MSNNRVKSLIVLDPAIKDFHLLERYISKGTIPETDVIVLEPNTKEIEQITCAIQKYNCLSDIHLISQGLPGCLYLGNSSLSNYNFNHYTYQLKKWSVSNIFLYGCNVGAEEIGKKFIINLHQTTGAKIYTMLSSWGIHTKVGIGFWTKSSTLIKSELTALTV